MRRATIFSLLLSITVYGLFIYVSGAEAQERITSHCSDCGDNARAVDAAGNINQTRATYASTVSSPTPTACTKTASPGINLRAFIDTLTPGDVGCLRSGVYGARGAETYVTGSGTPSAPITVRGYPGEAMPTILGYFPIAGQYIIISGLLFDGPTGLVNSNPPNPAVERNPIAIFSSNVEIYHCEIRNGLAQAGIYLQDTYNARIIGNYIHDNGRFGNSSTAYQDHGIYFGSGSGLIANNIIEHNWSYGIQLYPSASGVIVQQNTIIKNVQSGIIIADEPSDPNNPPPMNNLIVNNIVAYNQQNSIVSWQLPCGGNNIVRKNLVWGNGNGNLGNTADCLTLVDNIQADPRFVETSNYRLHFESPAINAALDPYTQPDDYDFVRRPQGAASDIGAFEFKFMPTAAGVSVSGRVLSARGKGVSRAVVHLTKSDGEIQTAGTNSFGYYTFADIPAGESYILNVYAKRYQFNPQVINLTEDLDELNFTAQ